MCGGSYRAPYKDGEGKVYVYDVQTNAWSNLPDRGTLPPVFASNYACVHYDTAADRMIVAVFNADRRGVFAFDPEAAAWDAEPLPFPAAVAAGGAGRSCWNGFYALDRNAHFFHTSGDSDDRGTVWAYRYRRASR